MSCPNCRNVLQMLHETQSAEKRRRKQSDDTIRHFQNLSHELLNIISQHHIQLPQNLVRKTLAPSFSAALNSPQRVSRRLRLIDADEEYVSASAGNRSNNDAMLLSMSVRSADQIIVEPDFSANVVRSKCNLLK